MNPTSIDRVAGATSSKSVTDRIAARSWNPPGAKTIADRVRERLGALGCRGVWARASGPHVLLGRDGGDAFARVTPLGPGAFALAFRSVANDAAAQGTTPASAWDAVLLIDELPDVVEHALVGEGALATCD
jgi:hypothetical protein